MNKHRINVDVDESLLNRVRKAQAKTGYSLSQIVRSGIEIYLVIQDAKEKNAKIVIEDKQVILVG